MRVGNGDTRSLRAVRLRAIAPRALFYFLVAVLSLAGLRTILASPSEPLASPRVRPPATADAAAATFAEGFARAYLTWDADDPEAHARRLAPYAQGDAESNAGMSPAENTSQLVAWTAVAAVQRTDDRTSVTVVADTGAADLTYLSVAVERDAEGRLRLGGYPAFVGPPGVSTDVDLDRTGEDGVDDTALAQVVLRALENHLGHAQENLLADLTPDAVVSAPSQSLTVVDTGEVTWVAPGRRVAARVVVRDEAGSSWTLRYEVEVVKRDRWYVRSIQVDPNAKGE